MGQVENGGLSNPGPGQFGAWGRWGLWSPPCLLAVGGSLEKLTGSPVISLSHCLLIHEVSTAFLATS